MKINSNDLGSYGAIPTNDAKSFIAEKSKFVIGYSFVCQIFTKIPFLHIINPDSSYYTG
jgi:hypothetical protein